jgi:hypothetical protein
MSNPNPDCTRQDCKFTKGAEFTTAAYYLPVYNKEGMLVSTDGNTTTCEVTCIVCGQKWKSKTQFGVTEYTECPPLPNR